MRQTELHLTEEDRSVIGEIRNRLASCDICCPVWIEVSETQIMAVPGEKPAAMEELREKAQQQPAVYLSRLSGGSAQENLNRLLENNRTAGDYRKASNGGNDAI